jgi:hypothetical protein
MLDHLQTGHVWHFLIDDNTGETLQLRIGEKIPAGTVGFDLVSHLLQQSPEDIADIRIVIDDRNDARIVFLHHMDPSQQAILLAKSVLMVTVPFEANKPHSISITCYL